MKAIWTNQVPGKNDNTCLVYAPDINRQQNVNAVLYYPDPKPAAENITDYLAFWKSVN
jgi:uncharacterized protein (DUF427 family)